MGTTRILVIGGTYFAGRVFSIYASRREDIELTCVNRGSRPLRRDNVTELVADRTDAAALKRALRDASFDAVIDFCAYHAGDVRAIFESGVTCGRYVLLSTVNVYQPDAPSPQDESTPRSTVEQIAARPGYPPELVDYLSGKRRLEDELLDCCADANTGWTILRPSFIYGPFDYTPRLLTYLNWLAHGDPLPFPDDSRSRFSFIYVKDLAQLLFKVLETPATRNQAYNLAAPDAVDWPRFEACLGALPSATPHRCEHLSVAQIDEQRIPIMFPLEGDEWYSGDKIARDVGGFTFTTFEQGLAETWDILKDVL